MDSRIILAVFSMFAATAVDNLGRVTTWQDFNTRPMEIFLYYHAGPHAGPYGNDSLFFALEKEGRAALPLTVERQTLFFVASEHKKSAAFQPRFWGMA